ncbi:Fe-S cluster assembly ATPase SufC [Candidatus Peregrinibacteria bacterium CG_4_10_14_0_2_um_filter_43_11]|nr:MAG: Fe-S cluster assembly ATPase SufC [Candidatus Peregrinibacteria bacterium CG_4_10_14_0_2_um_filter_43_11]
MNHVLSIKNLHVEVEGKPVLKGVELTITPGETHAIMGPNGSGKSTLANAIMGHPKYTITKGDIRYNGKSILNLTPDKRALLGFFLSFQYPQSIQGVSVEEFLLAAYRNQQKYLHPDKPPVLVFRFKRMLKELMEMLQIDEKMAERDLNYRFSGGEKKKTEILQMAVLKPTMAILDETDSGLDVDALKTVCKGVALIKKQLDGKMGILLITHYQHILKYIKPDHVHVLKEGRIAKSGGASLAHQLEKKGYEWIR